MGLQLIGTRKCSETRKAERWLKERRISFQFVDLAERGLSPGELDSVASAVGGYEALIDTDSRRYRDRGLAYMEFDPREELLEDPGLLRTPILRRPPEAAVGFDPEVLSELVR